VRLAESLAKMRLGSQVQAVDVYEALRLFRTSTLATASTKSPVGDMHVLAEEQRVQIQNAENFVKQRVPIGTDVSTVRLLEEGVSLGHSDSTLRRAISIMNHRTELAEFNRGQRFRRLR